MFRSGQDIHSQVTEHPGGHFAKFLNRMLTFVLLERGGVGGIMVSIAAFQAVDPGSIPGRRIFSHFESGVKMVT